MSLTVLDLNKNMPLNMSLFSEHSATYPSFLGSPCHSMMEYSDLFVSLGIISGVIGAEANGRVLPD